MRLTRSQAKTVVILGIVLLVAGMVPGWVGEMLSRAGFLLMLVSLFDSLGRLGDWTEWDGRDDE